MTNVVAAYDSESSVGILKSPHSQSDQLLSLKIPLGALYVLQQAGNCVAKEKLKLFHEQSKLLAKAL